jgi:hypothetical protein
MTDQPLSPAAQAIMVAATNGNFNVVNDPVYKQCIAAALRAAADQVVPQTPTSKYLEDYESGVWEANHDARTGLLAIAAELEAQ